MRTFKWAHHEFEEMKTMLLAMAIFLISSCAVQVPGPSYAKAPLVVYKTRRDYRPLVSVELSEDGKSVSAFPAPSDVEAQRPVELANGF